MFSFTTHAQVLVLDFDHPELFDFEKLEKNGVSDIKAVPKIKDFLNVIHQYYLDHTLNTGICNGDNSLLIDPKYQIIRLFILNHDHEHPFKYNFGITNKIFN